MFLFVSWLDGWTFKGRQRRFERELRTFSDYSRPISKPLRSISPKKNMTALNAGEICRPIFQRFPTPGKSRYRRSIQMDSNRVYRDFAGFSSIIRGDHDQRRSP